MNNQTNLESKIRDNFSDWESNFYLEFGRNAKPKEVADWFLQRFTQELKALREKIESQKELYSPAYEEANRTYIQGLTFALSLINELSERK